MSLSEFASGALFAVGLFSSGVYAPDVIRSQFNFTSNVMITTMMAASAASAIVMDIIDRLGIIKKKHSTPSNLGLFPYDGNVIGGILLGVGMAVTGSCLGTTFIQAGTGSAHGALVVLGGLIGALVFVKLQEHLRRSKAEVSISATEPRPEAFSLEIQSKTPLDIATALHISPMALLLIWVPMCMMVMRLAFVTDHSLRQPSNPGLIPPAYGGLLIGLAQLATMVLTRHAIGASSAYEDVARWLCSKVAPSPTDSIKGTLLTGPVIFSIGMVCSAALLNRSVNEARSSFMTAPSHTAPSEVLQSLVGGCAMVLGARIARGCTSGHGISGLSKFSLPSLVSTASMFGAGIATAAFLQY